MEFEKLFTAVVIGGSLLTAGCAKKTAEATANTPPATEASATDTEATATDTQTAATDDKAAPATDTETEQPSETIAPKAKDNDASVNCDEVCSGGNGREQICPDPTQDDIENCCWLMVQRHECCDS